MDILNVLIIITLVLIGYIVFKMYKDKLMAKMAFRNIFRRKIDTALIIIGSCIGTALITGAFSMNDSMESFIYSQIKNSYGEIDESVEKIVNDEKTYFQLSDYDDFLKSIEEKGYTDAILPLLTKRIMIGKPGTIRNPLSNNSREVLMIGADAQKVMNFDSDYKAFKQLDDLKTTGNDDAIGVVLHEKSAESLGVEVGDKIELLANPENRLMFWNELPEGKVIAIVKESEMVKYYERNSSNFIDRIFIPGKDARKFLGISSDDVYNTILISNKGDYLRGNDYSGKVSYEFFEKNTDPNSGINMLKRTAIENSENNISGWMFLALSSFTIIAGLLLLSNIYTMLVEERKVEMGTMRAIGFTRKKVNSLIVYEGFFYSLISSFFGVIAGIFVSMYILNRFSGVVMDIGEVLPKNLPFEISIPTISINFHISFSSIFFSLLIGFLLPMLVILVNGRKTSSMNIVKAIRGIADEDDEIVGVRKKRIKISLLILGGFSLGVGLTGNSILFFLGVIMVIGSAGALFREKYMRFTVSLAAVIIILFASLYSTSSSSTISYMGMSQINTVIFTILRALSILFSVLFLVVYNLRFFEVLLKKVMVFLKGSPAVIKVAIAFPARNTRKTAFTIAMYTIVMFVITIFSIIPHSETEMIRKSDNSLFLGYDAVILAFPFMESDVPNIYLDQIKEMDEVELFTQVNVIPSILKDEYGTFASLVIAVEDNFRLTDENVSLLMNSIMYSGQEALDIFNKSIESSENKTVVNFNISSIENDEILSLTGFSSSQFTPHMTYKPGLMNVKTGTEIEISPDMKIISDNLNLYSGIMMNKKNVPMDLLKTGYRISMVAIKGDTPEEMRNGYEKISKFIQNKGMFSIFTGDIIRLAAASIMGFSDILRSFLYFGLFVGITGIAIIMFKALFKRRRLIGMMKSIGFTKKMVFASFIFETSFVVILGIVIGLLAGTITSYQFLELFVEMGFKIHMEIPYALLTAICFAIYGISFLVTLIPSILASRIPPADALRYFE